MGPQCYFLLVTIVFMNWNVFGTKGENKVNVADDMLTNGELLHLLSLFGSKSQKKPKLNFYLKKPQATTSIPQRVLQRRHQTFQRVRDEATPKEMIKQLNLLNALLTSERSEDKVNERVNAIFNTVQNNAKPKAQSQVLESMALLNALMPSKESAPPALRATSEKDAANLLADLLVQNPLKTKPRQNFDNFKDMDINVDAAASDQLSSLISLLGTIGSLGGGASQMNTLLSLASPQPDPLFGNIFQQNTNHQQNSLATLLGALQPTPQPLSLIGLGSSVSSLVGSTFRRLSGTRVDGKPRVRGFDTRLGLGYRLGQNIDGQMMWEVGPQIFTEPLENEHRDAAPSAAPQYSPELQRHLAELITNNQFKRRREAEKIREEHHLEKLLDEPSQHFLNLGHIREPPRYTPKRLLKPVVPLRVQRPYTPSLPSLAEVPGPAPMVRVVPSRTHLAPLPAQRVEPPVLYSSQRVEPPVLYSSRQVEHPVLYSSQRVEPPARYSSRLVEPPVLYSSQQVEPSVLYSSQRKEELNPVEMLTPYEKWLMSRSQGFSNRDLSPSQDDENSHWEIPNPMHPQHDYLDKRVLLLNSKNKELHDLPKVGRRIIRKSEEPNAAVFAKRMGFISSPSRPNYSPYAAGPPFSPGFHYGRFAEPRPAPLRRIYTPYAYPPLPLPQYVRQPQMLYQRMSPPLRKAPAATTSNPFQNFIPESDDSFNRRNAIASRTGSKSEGDVAQVEYQSTLRPLAELTEARLSLGSMLSRVTNTSRSVIRVLFPTTTLPPIGANLVGGDYNPVDELLIATPTPTPIPTFFDHFGRPRTTTPTTPAEHHNPMIHIGEQLSYDELASSMDLSVRPKTRTVNGTNIKVKTQDKGDVLLPVNHPGMEMFIDIDSGEVSIRKPLATLMHFGDVTTTIKPKTADELEDEESLKIYERLQNHFKNSMEEYHLQQEILAAAKDHKEKMKKQEDDSLGMVTRYFDLLEDDEGQNRN